MPKEKEIPKTFHITKKTKHADLLGLPSDSPAIVHDMRKNVGELFTPKNVRDVRISMLNMDDTQDETPERRVFNETDVSIIGDSARELGLDMHSSPIVYMSGYRALRTVDATYQKAVKEQEETSSDDHGFLQADGDVYVLSSVREDARRTLDSYADKELDVPDQKKGEYVGVLQGMMALRDYLPPTAVGSQHSEILARLKEDDIPEAYKAVPTEIRTHLEIFEGRR